MTCKPRIKHLDPPYSRDVAEALSCIHPGVSSRDVLKLFRTLTRNLPLSGHMFRLGRFMLGRSDVNASFDLRTREIVIGRITARCACEYEWGVHIAAYAEQAGIDRRQACSLVHGSARDSCWSDADRNLIDFVDQLHGTGHVCDATWARMQEGRPDATLIELLVLVGWYQAVSYVANGARVEPESWARRFPSRDEYERCGFQTRDEPCVSA